MKKLFFIIIETGIDTSYFSSKISELGNSYRLYQSKFFLFAEFVSAQELYEKIIIEEYQQAGVVVLEIPIQGFSYWGYSDKGLWAWLDSVLTEATAQSEQK